MGGEALSPAKAGPPPPRVGGCQGQEARRGVVGEGKPFYKKGGRID